MKGNFTCVSCCVPCGGVSVCLICAVLMLHGRGVLFFTVLVVWCCGVLPFFGCLFCCFRVFPFWVRLNVGVVGSSFGFVVWMCPCLASFLFYDFRNFARVSSRAFIFFLCELLVCLLRFLVAFLVWFSAFLCVLLCDFFLYYQLGGVGPFADFGASSGRLVRCLFRWFAKVVMIARFVFHVVVAISQLRVCLGELLGMCMWARCICHVGCLDAEVLVSRLSIFSPVWARRRCPGDCFTCISACLCLMFGDAALCFPIGLAVVDVAFPIIGHMAPFNYI